MLFKYQEFIQKNGKVFETHCIVTIRYSWRMYRFKSFVAKKASWAFLLGSG